LSDLNRIWSFSTDFHKNSEYKFHDGICGQTDRYDEACRHFSLLTRKLLKKKPRNQTQTGDLLIKIGQNVGHFRRLHCVLLFAEH